MAIVFISPRKRQRIFFWSLILSMISVLFIISLIVFPPSFLGENQSSIPTFSLPGEVFPAPVISVNFKILDSDRVKSLELVPVVSITFDYTAKDKDGKTVTGQITAGNQSAALAILTSMGLQAIHLKESSAGRSEPFVPYYQVIPTKK